MITLQNTPSGASNIKEVVLMVNEKNTRKEQFKELDAVIEQWKDEPGGLLPIMQHAQEIIGCVDEEVQKYISDKTGAPVSTIYGIATFYSLFTLEPNGKYTIGLCLVPLATSGVHRLLSTSFKSSSTSKSVTRLPTVCLRLRQRAA